MAHVPAERCLGILELLGDGAREMPLGWRPRDAAVAKTADDVGAQRVQLADRLALPKSATHRLLSTLVDLDWAEQDCGTGFYRLTMRLAVLGQRFYVASGVPEICQPLLDRLARDSREFVRLAVVDGAGLVWIAHAQGARGGLVYQPSETTSRVPLYATASGKAWLATLPSEMAVGHVMKNDGFEHADRYGPNAIRSIEALLRDLRATARRGYGVAQNEAEPGVTAVAAAVRSGPGGDAVGTVSIAGPTARVIESRVRELASMVMQCATDLSNVWPLRPKIVTPGLARALRGRVT